MKNEFSYDSYKKWYPVNDKPLKFNTGGVVTNVGIWNVHYGEAIFTKTQGFVIIKDVMDNNLRESCEEFMINEKRKRILDDIFGTSNE